MPNGAVRYNVTLSGINLFDNSSIIITPDTATVIARVYTIDHLVVPYSSYTAVVVAYTGAGASSERTVTKQVAQAGKCDLACEIILQVTDKSAVAKFSLEFLAEVQEIPTRNCLQKYRKFLVATFSKNAGIFQPKC